MGPPTTFDGSSDAGACAWAEPAASVAPSAMPRLRNRRRFIDTSPSRLVLERLQHALGQERKIPHARAGGGKDRVAQRGRHDPEARLAHARRILGALHEVHLDLGDLVHPEYVVVVEVLLV